MVDPLQIGPYRVESTLGVGGMGKVYRAYDERLGRRVAIKQIRLDSSESPRARRRFLREARATARLNHPGIVKVHDLLSLHGKDWIVMEEVEGEPLSHVLAGGSMAPGRVLNLAIEMAKALGAAHREGIVHRDLKGQNVIVSRQGRPKLLDFGLAKKVRVGKEQTSSIWSSAGISIEGQLVGTPHAMSPEQALGKKVDPRSDLFALGALLYEMLTGISPFRSESLGETLVRVCTHPQSPVMELRPEVPVKFSKAIDWLLEKDRARRPQSAEALILTLGRIATGHDVDLPSDSRQRPTAFTVFSDEAAETLASVGWPSLNEQRQATVLCCDLMAIGGASGAAGAEALFAALHDYGASFRKIIDQQGGHIAADLGHRLWAYFGFPGAHEDDGSRAAIAALALQERFREPETRSTMDLAVRIGIHTGEIGVLKTEPSPSRVVLGPTLDRAIAVGQMAGPGEVLLSDDTLKVLVGTFQVESAKVGEAQLHRLVASEEHEHPRPTASGEALPLFGRAGELDILSEGWQRVCSGQGQVFLISGEAGIGKSHLVQGLLDSIDSSAATQLVAQNSNPTINTPFASMVDLLRRLSALRASEQADRRDQLKAFLSRLGIHAENTYVALAKLLAIPLGDDGDPDVKWSPEKRRKEIMKGLTALILGMAAERPTLLVVEDLHWADPTSLEWMGMLIASCARSRLAIIATFRPSFIAPWNLSEYLAQIDLSRLATAQAKLLISRITHGRPLPREIEEEILRRTDGVPLFLEELTKHILESGLLREGDDGYELKQPLEHFNVPTTLRDSLMARLDRLGDAKPIAQLASVIGREFSLPLLKSIAPIEFNALEASLQRLMTAGLIQRRGFSTRRRFVFKHALIHDTAYESLFASERRRLHQQIAQTLKVRFPNLAERQPEQLAFHFENAGMTQEAVSYSQLAGQNASDSSAHIEAVRYFEKGLRLLETLPESEDRNEEELGLSLALCKPLLITRGYTSDSVEALCDRALDLAVDRRELGDRFRLLYRFQFIHRLRGNIEKTLDILQQIHTAAERLEDPASMAVASYSAGNTAFVRGDFPRALEHLKDPASRFVRDQHASMSWQYGDDPFYNALLMRAWSLNLFGDFTGSLAMIDLAVEHAEILGDPFILTQSLGVRAGMLIDAGRISQTPPSIERAIDLASEHEFGYYRVICQTLRGLVVADSGDIEAAQQLVYDGLKVTQRIGIMIMLPVIQVRFASILLKHNRIDEALGNVEAAIGIGQEYLCRNYLAEALRLKGELLRRCPARVDEVEPCLRGALDLSRQQGAGLFEAKVTRSLENWLNA